MGYVSTNEHILQEEKCYKNKEGINIRDLVDKTGLVTEESLKKAKEKFAGVEEKEKKRGRPKAAE